MFDQQKYINDFIKENYKELKIRIRRDDKLILNKLSEVDNITKYIASLIVEDVYRNHRYRFINNEIDQFEAYLNVFLANTQLLLDDYEMNGFSIDDDDAVAERVYSLLKEKLNKSPTIQ